MRFELYGCHVDAGEKCIVVVAVVCHIRVKNSNQVSRIVFPVREKIRQNVFLIILFD